MATLFCPATGSSPRPRRSRAARRADVWRWVIALLRSRGRRAAHLHNAPCYGALEASCSSDCSAAIPNVRAVLGLQYTSAIRRNPQLVTPRSSRDGLGAAARSTAAPRDRRASTLHRVLALIPNWMRSAPEPARQSRRPAHHALHVMLAGYTLSLRWRPQGLDALSFLACFALVALIPVGTAYPSSRRHESQHTPSSASPTYDFPGAPAYHSGTSRRRGRGGARGRLLLLTPSSAASSRSHSSASASALHHAIGMALIVAGVAIATASYDIA